MTLTFPETKSSLFAETMDRYYQHILNGGDDDEGRTRMPAIPRLRQPTGKTVEKACFIPSKKVIW